MIKVWVMVMVVTSSTSDFRKMGEGTTSIVLDDIPSKQICESTAEAIGKRLNADGKLQIRYVCTERLKVKSDE